MLLLIGFLLTILFGLLISFVFISKEFNPIERLGLSYVVGLGLQTFFMFLMYVLGYKFNLLNTLLILLTVIIPLLILERIKLIQFVNGIKTVFSINTFKKHEKITVGIIALFILFSLWSTLYWPVSSWDSLVLYDWRAKLFYLTGTMTEGISRGYFFGVPLLTSLAHTWAYFLGAKQPEFIYTLYLASFAAMFYGALRMFTTRTISLITTLLLITTPDIFMHSTFSYTNFPYTVYFVMSTIYLYIWMVKEKSSYLPISAILLGLSTWTRSSEPFWIVNLLVLIIFCIYKRKVLSPVFFGIFFFLIRQPWVWFENSKLDYSTTVSSKIIQGISVIFEKINIGHTFIVLKFLYDNFFVGIAVFLFAFIFVLTLEFKQAWRNKDFWLSSMVIGYVLLVVVGTYVFSLTFRDWEIGGSLTRMGMFIPPLIYFYVASSKKINDLFVKTNNGNNK